MSDGDKAVVKAEFKIIGTRDEVAELFLDLQANGLLTAPDALVLQYTVVEEGTALLMREKLQLILQRNRAVVKDGKKGVTLTFKQATPKPSKRREEMERGQTDMFESQPHPDAEVKDPMYASLAERIVTALRASVHGMTPEQLAEVTGGSVAAVKKELDSLFAQDLVDPEGNVWEIVSDDEETDD